MKKDITRILFGILTIIISNIFIFYLNLFILNIHEATILKWTPLISTFIGFYFVGLVTKKVKVKYTLFLFIPILMFIPVNYFYFPLIIFITLFAVLALALIRNEFNKKMKVVFLITGILVFSYFLFNEPLIIRQEGFETTAEGNFINAKIIWDFNDYETIILPEEAFNTLKNEKIKLTAFEDKTLYINFWATWCGPCKEEKPI